MAQTDRQMQRVMEDDVSQGASRANRFLERDHAHSARQSRSRSDKRKDVGPMRSIKLRPCPTCGRPLRVQPESIDHIVVCQHCGAKFIAGTRDNHLCLPTSEANSLRRANELLQQAARKLAAAV